MRFLYVRQKSLLMTWMHIAQIAVVQGFTKASQSITPYGKKIKITFDAVIDHKI